MGLDSMDPDSMDPDLMNPMDFDLDSALNPMADSADCLTLRTGRPNCAACRKAASWQ
jgi:hypothetical protein